jgi:hypothetical protein
MAVLRFRLESTDLLQQRALLHSRVNISKRDPPTGTMLMRYGTYFIDGDPTLFEVILQCLGTGRLPLFFDSTTTHDLAKYAALLGEARYSQIHKLEACLSKRIIFTLSR